jgi:hypothetical protein
MMRNSLWIVLTAGWAAVCVVLVTAASSPPLAADEAQVRPNPPAPTPGPAPGPHPSEPAPGPNPPPLNPTDGGA